MKKSLISLALAGVATTALASTSLYSSETAKVDTYGELRTAVVVKKNKTSVDNVKTEKNSVTSFADRLRVGLKGNFKSGDFTYGFDSRLSWHYALNKFSETKYEDSKANKKKYKKNSGKGFLVDHARVKLGYTGFGTLTYGKTQTVLDRSCGDDLVVLGQGFISAVGQTTKFDNTLVYDAPSYEGFKGSVSFGETKSGHKAYEQQVAAGVNFDYEGNHVQFVTGYTFNKDAGHKVNRAKSYDLTFSNDALVENLELTADLSFEKNSNFVADSSAVASRNKAFGVSAKAAYAYNEYFKPYFGTGFVKATTNAYGTSKATTKTYGVYVGANSDVYSYETVKVNVFGEVVAQKAKTKTDTYADSKTTKSTAKRTDVGFAVGARVRF